MRCPKCGYISFDHLSSCSNCSRDLTALAEELHGTSIETDLSLFLGSVIGEEPTDEELQFDEQIAATDQSADFFLEEAATTEDSEITIQLETQPATPEPEAPSLALEPELQPELTLDMDEMAALDMSQIEEESGLEEEQPVDQTEMLLAEADEFHEGQAEQLTLNLDEIDLSDLAPLDEEQDTLELSVPTTAEPEPETEQEITLDLGDDTAAASETLDLGSTQEEDNGLAILDLEDFMFGTGLEKTPEAEELKDMPSNKAKEDSKAGSGKTNAATELKLTLESDDE